MPRLFRHFFVFLTCLATVSFALQGSAFSSSQKRARKVSYSKVWVSASESAEISEESETDRNDSSFEMAPFSPASERKLLVKFTGARLPRKSSLDFFSALQLLNIPPPLVASI